MNLTTLAIVIALLFTSLALFASRPCFDKTSDKCAGYSFAKANALKSADECKYANKPYFNEGVSEEFMRGCRESF